MNVGQAVAQAAMRNPSGVAVFDDSGSLTYQQLDQMSNRLARGMVELWECVPGDRVAVYLPNRKEVVELLVASAKAGLVYVGLNFRLDDRELTAVLTNAEPRIMFTCGEFFERLEPFAKEFDFRLISIDAPESGQYHTCLNTTSSDVLQISYQTPASDEFCIVYSSGTTGTPKGILFDHAAAMQHALVAIIEYGIEQSSKYLVQIPHNSSVNITILPCLIAGAAIGFEESRGFTPERFANRIHKDQITHSFVVPTMLFRILEGVPVGDRRMESLITLGYGASSIPPERVNELVARFGDIFIQLYGMAEIASIGTLLRKQDHAKALAGNQHLLASAGRASLVVTVRVVDPDGHDVPIGERGEVVFAGPHLMRGYFRDPDRTAEAIRDGWMHSGDLGVLDSEGYLYIVGRIKDLIIRGGFNIAPREIEETLQTHPAVLEAAVIGIPDEEWGESLHAVVSFKEGQSSDPAALIDWCVTAGLASIKVPQSLAIVEDLPKNLVGKIDKQVLRSMYLRPGGHD